MYQLTIDFIDYAVELAIAKYGFQSLSLKTFEEFQPVWVLVMSIFWVSLKQSIKPFVENSNRTIGLIHAISMVIIGFPVLFLLGSTSFAYSDMFNSFVDNHRSIAIICNTMCYTSVGYFLMDSYFLAHTAYLKHHIGAIVVWMCAAYHHDTSLVHGAVVIAFFETGAILVQLSRSFKNILWFRTFVCIGYTGTRVGLAWYYGFIHHTSLQLFSTCSLGVQIVYFPIYASLLFLLTLNAKWTYLQWVALIKAYKSEKGLDFYTYHQKIIGSTA